ncbi:MAG: hypothetical protein ACFFD4_29615 [Candidatus Odinarchaeota archaeon]
MKLPDKHYWKTMQRDALEIFSVIIEQKGAVMKSDLENLPDISDLFGKYGVEVEGSTLGSRVSDLLRGMTFKGRGGSRLINYGSFGNTRRKIITEISPAGQALLKDLELKKQADDGNIDFYNRELSFLSDRLDYLSGNRFLAAYRNELSSLQQRVESFLKDGNYSGRKLAEIELVDLSFLDCLELGDIINYLESLNLQGTTGFCSLLFYKQHPLLKPVLQELLERNRATWLEQDFYSLFELLLLQYLVDQDKRSSVIDTLGKFFGRFSSIFPITRAVRFFKKHNRKIARAFLDDLPPALYSIERMGSDGAGYSGYFEFLEEVFSLNRGLFDELLQPFLEYASSWSAKTIFSALQGLSKIYKSAEEFHDSVNVVKHVLDAIKKEEFFMDFICELDEVLDAIALPEEDRNEIITSLKVKVVESDDFHFVNLLTTLRWKDWPETAVIREVLKGFDIGYYSTILKENNDPVIFGEALLGMTRLDRSLTREVVHDFGTDNILELFRGINTFEKFRFLIYGIANVDPAVLEMITGHINVEELVPLITVKELSRLAWFYVGYGEKIPGLVTDLVVNVIRDTIAAIVKELDDPDGFSDRITDLEWEFKSMLEIIWKNAGFQAEILEELVKDDSIKLYEGWTDTGFLLDLLVVLDDQKTLQWLSLDSPEHHGSYFDLVFLATLEICSELWARDNERYGKVLKGMNFAIAGANWEHVTSVLVWRKILTMFDRGKLDWMVDSHPEMHAMVARKKLQDFPVYYHLSPMSFSEYL